MNGADRILVGVVDDHDLMVAGIRALLSAHNSPARFVAGARTVPGLIRVRRDLDVVVLDVRLGDGSTAEENVHTLSSRGYTVLLHADSAHREALPVLSRTPARGLVWKNDPARTLMQAIVTVARGGLWSSPSSPKTVDLTHRETEVLRLYASGLKYAETAAALQPPVSVESVKTYLSRIRRRYDEAGRPASTRIELRQRALEDGLLPPELGRL
ncbi:MAG TPA: response regulator transcription factor [Pedococcus sp.]|jgi:two-component system, NarL family, response regulator DevR|nr:response regulator transcription factor [Pedococcus sp.]